MDSQVLPKGVESKEASGNAQVLNRNGLVYKMPQSLSTTVNKTFIKNYSQRQTYTSARRETIVFDINSGSRYIDPENCCLILEVKVNGDVIGGDTNVVFSANKMGANALIQEILITAKNGNELDRISGVNYYSMIKSSFESSSDYMELYGELWGVNRQFTNDAMTQTFVLPLKLISGLFRPSIKGMKMPASLLSGARIEITLEAPEKAFYDVGVTEVGNLSYEIHNPTLLLLSHELNDDTQRVLNEESANNGLEYTYTRVFTTQYATLTDTANIQVKKAVAQGLRAWCVSIDTAKLGDEEKDSFATVPASDLNSYQYRIGSFFYPQQKVNTPEEALFVTYNCFSRNQGSEVVAGSVPKLTYDTRLLTLGSSFETDGRLHSSGMPINNSATLELQVKYNAVPVGGLTHMVFLEYLAVASSFLTNVSVQM